MEAKIFWNEIGSKKTFEDPLYINKLQPYLNEDSRIVEYGCGYGRLLNILQTKGYQNLTGFDYAPNMIERGSQLYPTLNLNLIEKSAEVPLEDNAADLVIMSTILCCMIENQEQIKLIEEIKRILKKGSILYLADFMVSDHPRYFEKYQKGKEAFGQWGIYTTNENITVRHYSTKWIMELLKDFNIKWFEQTDFKTMNQNPAKTFHCIAEL